MNNSFTNRIAPLTGVPSARDDAEIIFGPGRRVWVGGDSPPDAYGAGKGVTREVLIPPGRCVYFWLGCEAPREVGNFCQAHHVQDTLEELADQVRMAAERREAKRARRRERYARQVEKERRKRRDRYAASRAEARRTYPCAQP